MAVFYHKQSVAKLPGLFQGKIDKNRRERSPKASDHPQMPQLEL